MNATRKVKLKDITANLRCKLCLGYLVDATTIIECLHSFCKSCIIKYLDKSADLEEKYCPVCDVQLHSTKPLTSIRADLMLQEIVYKLVPGLFKAEMSQRRQFYGGNEDLKPSNQLDSGQVFDELYITSDDIIHLSLEYVTEDVKLRENTKRFLKCPAAVSVYILKKLLEGKYDLDSGAHIDVLFGDRMLPDDFLLMDIAYKYSWTMNGNKPLALRYRIKGVTKPVIKSEKAINDSNPKVTTQDEPHTHTKKKVCHENGSNIMPTPETRPGELIKLTGNGLITGELSSTAIKPPNGKVRGRKRKHLRYSDIMIESRDDIKNLKSLKMSQDITQSKPQINSQLEISSNDKTKYGGKEVKEVQLQISENGVMSARSVTSGEEKIIVNVASTSTSTTNLSNPSPKASQTLNLTEKLLLSGNFHSKTGPSGVTEIICDKLDPKPIKTASAKPGYVTLNIPTPSNQMLAQNCRVTNGLPNGNKIFTSSQESTSTYQNGSSPLSNESPTKKKSTEKCSKSSLMQKLKNRIASKAADGENVKKAISDLEKLCNSNSESSSSNGSETQRSSGTGMSSMHLMNSFNNHYQQQQRTNKSSSTGQKNSGHHKTIYPALPLALNFSPASGMSVSMIPCSAASNNLTNGNVATAQSQTPSPKRVSHQTTVVNGDLKFTTSPKHILPINGDHDGSPKKPPKFFKSRHLVSPVSSPSTSSKFRLPSPRLDNEGKRNLSQKSSGEPPQKKSKERKSSESPKQSTGFQTSFNSVSSPTTVNAGQGISTLTVSSSLNSVNGISRPLSYPSPNDKYSQHLNALNSLAINSVDPTFGVVAAAAVAAAAASNGNGYPLGMAPFVTENYCSMPFLNQRHNVPQLAQFPFAYSYPTIGYSALGATANLVSAINLPKPKPSNAHTNSQSRTSNGFVSGSNDGTSSTLDLSVGKTNDDTKSKESDERNKTPMLVRLLNSGKNPLEKNSVNSSDKNAKTTSTFEGKVDQTSDTNKSEKAEETKKDKKPIRFGDNLEKPISQNGTTATDKKECKETATNNSPAHGSGNKCEVIKVARDLKSDSSKKAADTKSDSDKSKNIETEVTVPKTNNGEGKAVPEQDKMLSLSAQNNNDHSMSNIHEKSSDDSSSKLVKNLDCANPSKSNGTSTVTEFSSKTGSA